MTTVGIFTQASGAITNYGIRAEVLNNPGAYGYAIFGKAPASPSNYAGYFNGHVLVTGTLTYPSDEKLKERAVPLDRAEVLSRVNQLLPKSYYYRTSPEYAHMGLPSTLQYGLIAQEVEQVFPELVKDEVQPQPFDDEGQVVGEEIDFKSVDYLKLIPLLVAALQEQQRRIEALEAALQR